MDLFGLLQGPVSTIVQRCLCRVFICWALPLYRGAVDLIQEVDHTCGYLTTGRVHDFERRVGRGGPRQREADEGRPHWIPTK